MATYKCSYNLSMVCRTDYTSNDQMYRGPNHLVSCYGSEASRCGVPGYGRHHRRYVISSLASSLIASLLKLIPHRQVTTIGKPQAHAGSESARH